MACTNACILTHKAKNQHLRLMPKRLDTGEIHYFYYHREIDEPTGKKGTIKTFSKEEWKELVEQWDKDYPPIKEQDHPETIAQRTKLVAGQRRNVWEAAKTITEWPKLNGEPLFKLDHYGNVIS
jgi:hypothetical protein